MRFQIFILFLSIGLLPDAVGQSMMSDSNFFSNLEYRCIGPTRGGRVTAVAGSASQPHTYYMGATGGGVWKTDDSGLKWSCISDGFFATPSIGAIAVAQNNPSRIYVGTGTDGLRSNLIEGKGVYRSDDEGKIWKHIGLEKTGQIGAVIIHPQHDDTLMIAAIGNAFKPNKERGVFKSSDGGTTWKQTLYISDSTGVVDLEYAPNDASTVYAALWQADRKPWSIKSGGRQGGIMRSNDGGETWSKLSKGLPDGLIGKIDLAVSPADPDRVVALIEAPDSLGGVYISYDKGDSWSLISTKEELLDRPFYYCNIDLNPQNANTIYVNATRFWKSTDNGKKWKSERTPHGDNHDMWINPNDSLLMVQGNDGGGNVTLNGGKSWSTQDNQPTAELYQVEVDDQIPYWLYAGQQDNTTISIPTIPPSDAIAGPIAFWTEVGGCETGPAVPKPGDPDIVYSNCKGRFGVFNKRTGQEQQYYVGASNIYGHNPRDLKFRFQRVSPIHVSSHNPDKVFHCSQYVHMTLDDGKTWQIISPDLTDFDPTKQVISGYPITRDVTGEEFYSTIYAIQESKLQEDLLWVGANDGPVHVTKDGGKNWANVTPKSLPGGGRIDCVEPSPHRTEKAFFTSLRYQVGDPKPYIYKTNDFGASWKLITKGIPDDFPVRVVREDPMQEGLLFAGTEFGMFISFDDGESWTPFQQNLPITPITDIKIYRNNLNLSTMGRSFWVMDDISPLRAAFGQKNAAQTAQLFRPLDTYMLRYRGSGGAAVPNYPSSGVQISYYIPDTVKGSIRIDIKSEEGDVVRSFSHLGKDMEDANQPIDMGTGEQETGGDAKIKIEPGLHRFIWDMRHEGPWDKKKKRPTGSGPRVTPGKYSVSLMMDGFDQTQQFKLMADPRILENNVSIADLKAQEQLSIEIQNLYSNARRLEADVESELKVIEEKLEGKKGNSKLLREKENLLAVQSMLNTEEGRYMTPMLLDQIRYLRSMLSRAEQLPGGDAFDRLKELKETFEVALEKADLKTRS